MQVGEQGWADTCCPAEAAGSDPEEWGPPKRVHSVLRGPCSHVEMLLPRPRPLWAADGGGIAGPPKLTGREAPGAQCHEGGVQGTSLLGSPAHLRPRR